MISTLDGLKPSLILGANVGYDAPAEMSIAAALDKVPFSAYSVCTPMRPPNYAIGIFRESHTFESWSDLRAVDGTAAIVQPLIRPLYATRSAHDLLAMLLGQNDARRTNSFAKRGDQAEGRL